MGVWGNLVWVIAILCALWVIIDVWSNQKRMKDIHKLLWTIGAIIFSIITAVVYYIVVKQKVNVPVKSKKRR